MQALVDITNLIGFMCLMTVSAKMMICKGPAHAIAGLLIPLYAFLWGWNNVETQLDRRIMISWSFIAAALATLVISFG